MTLKKNNNPRFDLLLLAPHPFYQERGTPMAVDMLLGVLSRRGWRISIITFAEGQNRFYRDVDVLRIPDIPIVCRGIPPGFSVKKLVCDVFMFFKATALIFHAKPRLLHAVEESVFMAMAFRLIFGIPYIYDMDSSMSLQILQKFPLLKPFGPIFRWCEGLAIRRALMVIPVCDSLADIARSAGASHVRVLTDVSMISKEATVQATSDAGDSHAKKSCPVTDLRFQFGIQGICFMYIGNLESYQGIDLLLDALAKALQSNTQLDLIVVGGTAEAIAKYQTKAKHLGIEDRTHFTGHLPVSMMQSLFEQADVLVSPRIKGENTPMKIYSYLDSGRPILATDLATHTQVLTQEVAELVRPEAQDMAQGMLRLASSSEIRKRLAGAAKELAERKYSQAAYESRLNAIYDEILTLLHGAARTDSVGSRNDIKNDKSHNPTE